MEKNKFYTNGYFNDTISSAILFIFSFLFVLYVSLSATAFISFTNQLTIPLEIDRIDFDRATSSNDSVWDSAENVFLIFSFSPLVIFILALLAVIAIGKIQNQTIKVFLFWVVFHSIIRLFGDFMFGQIFHLWGSNLVTDFMGLTYSNLYIKLIFIALALVSILGFPLLLSPLITPFFDPFSHKVDEGVKINFISPSLIGSIFIFLWFIPSFNINEICILIISVISVFIFSNYIVSKYKFVSITKENITNDRFNIKLRFVPFIISSIPLIALKIILTNGVVLRSSGYRRDQLDSVFYSSLLGVLLIAFIFFIGFMLISIKNKKNKKNQELIETLENIEKQQMDISLLEGTRWSKIGENIKKAQSFNDYQEGE